MMHLRRKIFLKAVFSLTFLVYLLASVELPDLVALVRQGKIGFFVATLATGVAAVALSAYKWKVLLAYEGLSCPWGELFRLYLIGIYFNNFLPTSIGGDAARIYLLSRKHGQPKQVIISVFTERVTGLIALVSFLILGLVVEGEILDAPTKLWLWGGSLFFLLCLFGLFVGKNKLPLQKCLPKNWRDWLVGMANDGRRWGGITDRSVAGMSLLFQFLSIFIYFLLSCSLSLSIPFSALILIVPLVALVTLLPISLNGLGLREGSWVFFLSLFHVSGSEALALSLLYFIVILLLSLCGGLLYFFLGSGLADCQPN